MMIRRFIPTILFVTALISFGSSANVFALYNAENLHKDHAAPTASITAQATDCASACAQNSTLEPIAIILTETQRKKEKEPQPEPPELDFPVKLRSLKDEVHVSFVQVTKDFYKFACAYLL